MMPEDTLSTTARATAACAGPNICTACVAFLMVTLLKRSVSGFAGRLGVTTASSLVKPSVLFANVRSEEHTSELQSHSDLVCRLLLEKKKKRSITRTTSPKKTKSHNNPNLTMIR